MVQCCWIACPALPGRRCLKERRSSDGRAATHLTVLPWPLGRVLTVATSAGGSRLAGGQSCWCLVHFFIFIRLLLYNLHTIVLKYLRRLQEADLEELIRQKEEVTAERDAQVEQIVALRSQVRRCPAAAGRRQRCGRDARSGGCKAQGSEAAIPAGRSGVLLSP